LVLLPHERDRLSKLRDTVRQTACGLDTRVAICDVDDETEVLPRVAGCLPRTLRSERKQPQEFGRLACLVIGLQLSR